MQIVGSGHFPLNSSIYSRQKEEPEKDKTDDRQPIKIHAVFFA